MVAGVSLLGVGDYLRTQNEHLLLAHLQFLIGGLELAQQQVVALLQLVGVVALGRAVRHCLTQLIQVILQLLVLRFKLLPL